MASEVELRKDGVTAFIASSRDTDVSAKVRQMIEFLNAETHL